MKRTSKKKSSKSPKKVVRGHFRATASGAKVWVAAHKARKRPASKRSSKSATWNRQVRKLRAALAALEAQKPTASRKRKSRKTSKRASKAQRWRSEARKIASKVKKKRTSRRR